MDLISFSGVDNEHLLSENAVRPEHTIGGYDYKMQIKKETSENAVDTEEIMMVKPETSAGSTNDVQVKFEEIDMENSFATNNQCSNNGDENAFESHILSLKLNKARKMVRFFVLVMCTFFFHLFRPNLFTFC